MTITDVTDHELQMLINVNSVCELFIYEEMDGFRVTIALKDKKGEVPLVTQQHRKVRYWVDLSRLIKHMNEKYIHTPKINLFTRNYKDDTSAKN